MKALLLCTLGAILVPLVLSYALVAIVYLGAALTRYRPDNPPVYRP